MKKFETKEQYSVHIHTTYLDDTKSSKGREYFGDVFLYYPSLDEINKIIEKFFKLKKDGKINAMSIDYARVEKRLQIYTDEELNS